MGKSQRTKGHSFERWVAKAMRKVFPGARRQLEYHADDCNGVDIADTGPFRVQCKAYANYAPISKIKEVQHDPAWEIPVLVTKGDFEQPMAVIPFEDFMFLVDGWVNRGR